MNLLDRVSKTIDLLFDRIIGPRSEDYAIDAHGIVSIVNELQRNRGARLTSVDINPVIQYNGMEGFPECAPGPGQYDRRNPDRKYSDTICMLVRYVLHFDDVYPKEVFLHSPVEFRLYEKEKMLEELGDYTAEQATILRDANLLVNIGHLQKYWGDGDTWVPGWDRGPIQKAS